MARIRVFKPGRLFLDMDVTMLLTLMWIHNGGGPSLPYTIETTACNTTEITQVVENSDAVR